MLCSVSIALLAKHLKLPQEEQEYSEAAEVDDDFYETCLGMIIDRQETDWDRMIKYVQYHFMFVLYFSSDKEFQIFLLSPPSLMKL